VLGFLVVLAAVLATIFRLIGYLFGDQKTQDEAIDGLAIFSDQSTALAEARREAEMLLEKERMAEAAPSVDTPEQKQ
jgi:hypothetical protein